MKSMQAIYVQRGEVIDFTNSTESNINVGDVVTLDKRIGIAGNNIPIGTTGVVHVSGVYEIDAETTAAFNVGQTVYFGAGKLTATTGDVVAGFVVAPKATASSKARVKIG